MANVITLPNGITIESTDPTAQNLTISREAYVVLENFSAESIYEAANFIMSQEDDNTSVQPTEEKRSAMTAIKRHAKGNALIGGVTGAVGGGILGGGSGAALGGRRGAAIGVPVGTLGGAAVGAAGGAIGGVMDGAASSLVNDRYYKKHGKNMSNARAGAIDGAISGGLRNGTAAASTAAGVLAHKRKVAKKREAELAAMNQYDSTESFTLPTGQVVKIV